MNTCTVFTVLHDVEVCGCTPLMTSALSDVKSQCDSFYYLKRLLLVTNIDVRRYFNMLTEKQQLFESQHHIQTLIICKKKKCKDTKTIYYELDTNTAKTVLNMF